MSHWITHPHFVSFEGGEGAGKSTVITAAAESLRTAGETVLLLREPGGTAVGEAVRAVLLNPELRGLCAESELLLMMASRAQLVRERILPALERGEWVLCDRFTDASFAYQGGGRGIDSGRIAELERWVAGLKPGLSFLLDLPVETGLARAGSRAAPDRIEAESIAFFERVRASYRSRAAAEPQRWCVLDASRPAEAVAAAVVQRLNIQREVSR
ncbi:dTMP kinase [uncultured Aquimonas sp.]|uniref:dTMP kinase n=1 Tax=uncultured Aquimonas sp. TaxID=385483 RepID=UPI000A45BBA9|nr:dTMP kinase [uncultured Aquimonas sp.]